MTRRIFAIGLIVSLLSTIGVILTGTVPAASQEPTSPSLLSGITDENTVQENLGQDSDKIIEEVEEVPTPDSNGETDDDNTTNDGLWRASVGGREFSKLSETNQGDILFQGEYVTKTVIEDDGSEKEITVCNEIPEIEVSNVVDETLPGSSSIILDLDFTKCTISIFKIESGIVSEDEHDFQVQGIEISNNPKTADAFNDSIVQISYPYPLISTASTLSEYGIYSHPILLLKSDINKINDAELPLSRTYFAETQAQVKAKDFNNQLLTNTRTRIDYRVSPFEYESHTSACKRRSPGWAFGVRWHVLACDNISFVERWNYFQAGTEGAYTVSVIGDSRIIRGNGRHNSTANLRVSTTRISGTCEWDPGSIHDLVIDVERDWVWDFQENGVQLVCVLETPRNY